MKQTNLSYYIRPAEMQREGGGLDVDFETLIDPPGRGELGERHFYSILCGFYKTLELTAFFDSSVPT